MQLLLCSLLPAVCRGQQLPEPPIQLPSTGQLHLPAHTARSCRDPRAGALVAAAGRRGSSPVGLLSTLPLSWSFSSLQAENCFFQCSMLAADSCRAVDSRALLSRSDCSSVSHFFTLDELRKTGHHEVVSPCVPASCCSLPACKLPHRGVFTLICCNRRKSTQMCGIALSHDIPRENKSLHLTASVKTKGSTNPSSSACVWSKSPAVRAGCRVQLPTCTQGSHPGRALTPPELCGCSTWGWAPAALQHSPAHLRMAQQFQVEDFRGLTWSIFEFILMLSLNYKSVT